MKTWTTQILSLFQDLFTFHHESACTTHEMLGCQCGGVGLVPHDNLHLGRKQNVTENDADELSSQRNCQLHVNQSSSSSTCVRMNQLFCWQHYSQPVSAAVLQVRVIKSVGPGSLVCSYG
jgi:DNA repair and recombination protein RAD54B